jgi:serine/threonine-protein kinase
MEALRDSLRTTVRLIDGESGVDFAAGAFTVPQGHLLAVRDSLMGLVEDLIRQELGEQVRLRLERSQAHSDEAWLALQRGERTRASVDSLLLEGDEEALQAAYERADSLFALAEALDPAWSEPAAHRAWLEYEHARWVMMSDPVFTDRWTTVGLEHANRALALDSLSADAFEARGILKYWRFLLGIEPDREAARALFASAEEDLRAAIALNPKQASAWSTLSHLLVNKSGDRSSQSQARLAAERALEADTYLKNADVVIRRLYLVSYDLEDIVRASRWCHEGASRYPEDPQFVDCQIMIMTFDSAEADVAEAWRLAESYVDLHPPNQQPFARLHANMVVAAVLARAGLADSASAVVDRSRGNPSIDPTRDLLMLGAFAHTRMESYDEAVALLTEFITANPILATDLTTSEYWWWRGLQDHPGFRALAQLGGELGG